MAKKVGNVLSQKAEYLNEEVVPYIVEAKNMRIAKAQARLANEQFKNEQQNPRNRLKAQVLISTGKMVNKGAYRFDARLKLRK